MKTQITKTSNIMYKYSNKIIEMIRKTKAVPGWSVSDYISSIDELYTNLLPADKKNFRLSLIELLKGKEYLKDIISIIWMKLRFKEARPILFELFLNPPKNLKEDGYNIGTEGVRLSSIVAIGELGYQKAVPSIKQLIEDKINRKKSKIPSLDLKNFGTVMQTLAKLSPKDTAKYFGWWIEKAQVIDSSMKTMVKGLNEWKIIEKTNAVPNLDLPTSGRGADSVRICLFNITQKHGLTGLKKWLKSVILVKSRDREYLRYQLEYLLEGKDKLFDLKQMLEFNGDPKLLAMELAYLPSL